LPSLLQEQIDGLPQEVLLFGETLYSLTESQVRNLEKARENARLFAEEVVERLRVPAR
jgi:hypothetical protein